MDYELQGLRQEVRELNRTLAGVQNALRIAAEYKNSDPQILIDGIQAALLRAAKYEGRSQKRGR